MTKIKNTKKGMAKKTLSVSLAVAMLATSNVPVWAAEFSDGAEAAFTSEVEAPVVEAEAPVVEDTVVAPVAEATVTDPTYGYTAEVELKANGNGWNGNLTADAPVVKDASGNTVAYKWTLRRDGIAVTGEQDKTGSLDYTGLSHDDYNHTFDLYIEISLADGKKVGLVSNSVTVGAVDITELGTGHYLYFPDNAATYNGNEQKLIPNTSTYTEIIPASDTGRINKTFTNNDFVYTYSGDLVNASKDDEYIKVTGVVKKAGTNEADPAYTGSLKGTYSIKPYALNLSNVTGSFKPGNNTFEYTGETIKFDPSDIEVKITANASGFTDEAKDLSFAVKKAESAGTSGKDSTGKQDVIITLDTSKLTNFSITSGGATVTATDEIKILKRNWLNVAVSLNRTFSYDEIKSGVRPSFTDLTFIDKTTQKELKFESVAISTIELDPSVIDVSNGKVTIAAKEGSKNYTGTKTADIKHELEKPATPMLANVTVTGNTATAVLSGDVEGATGYDFVIGTSRDCITTKDYVKVNKNVLKTETPFTYVQEGVYYAYCHAWKRDENGKKIFSDWSNAYPFAVSALTPDQPVITSVKTSGSTVTVTYTKAANADGYDVVLGSATKKVNGENRPINYGELVKKNIKGDTVTATFKNVPAGTYYAGLHAWNRKSEDGKKVFSPWSNTKTVTVK